MFSIGDHVVYGTNGVCLVSGIEARTVGGKRTDYYVLKPVHNSNSTVFVPMLSEKLVAKMKKILSRDDALALIRSIPAEECVWIDNDNERREKYRQIIAEGDRTELLRLIKTLHLHREKQLSSGKKLHLADERVLTEAENILHDEFAYVLDIGRDEITRYIIDEKDRLAENGR